MISVIFRRCTATMCLAVFASACVKFQASTSKAGFTYIKVCNGRACTGYFNVTLEAIGQDNESQVTQTINIYE